MKRLSRHVTGLAVLVLSLHSRDARADPSTSATPPLGHAIRGPDWMRLRQIDYRKKPAAALCGGGGRSHAGVDVRVGLLNGPFDVAGVDLSGPGDCALLKSVQVGALMRASHWSLPVFMSVTVHD